MPGGRANHARQPNPAAEHDLLPPVRFPFTIRTSGGEATEVLTERSLGHRLGLWWDEAGDGKNAVVITGMRPGGRIRDPRGG